MIDANRTYSPARGATSRTTVRILSSNFESTLAGNRDTPSRPDSSKSTSPYSPWNHEQFLARLKTFSDVKLWDPKPDRINEVAWAKRGWTVIAHNELCCKSCGERVLIKLDSQVHGEKDQTSEDDQKWWSAEAEEKLVEKYESLIVEGHEQTCLWRKAGSKGELIQSFARFLSLNLF
jgi:C3HC zinc finger-like